MVVSVNPDAVKPKSVPSKILPENVNVEPISL